MTGFPLLEKINNEEWRETASGLWEKYVAERFSSENSSAEAKARKYTETVMRISYDNAAILSEEYGIEIDIDILLLTAFLHKISVYDEYQETEDGIQKTYSGEIYPEGFLAASYSLSADLPPEVAANIISLKPDNCTRTMESQIVFSAKEMITALLETYNTY